MTISATLFSFCEVQRLLLTEKIVYLQNVYGKIK